MNQCIIKGCTNKRDNTNSDNFVGDLCVPCYEMVTTGITGIIGTTFIHNLNTKILGCEKLITNLLEVLEEYLK